VILGHLQILALVLVALPAAPAPHESDNSDW
jgi:hypothetical protein